MLFPLDLRIARKPLFQDLGEAPENAEYLACFGKSKGLGRLKDFPNLKTLWISGVNPKQLEKVAACHGLETLVVHELKVEDMSALERLPSLKNLLVWGNTKATQLDSLSGLTNLKILGMEHFSRIKDLGPLAKLVNLEVLSLEGSFNKAITVESLEPLGALAGLRELRLLNVKPKDNQLTPLSQLSRLENLTLGNLYPMEQVARLAATMVKTECNLFHPHFDTNIKCQKCDSPQLMAVQSSLSVLCPRCDAEKIKANKAAFEGALSRFRDSEKPE